MGRGTPKILAADSSHYIISLEETISRRYSFFLYLEETIGAEEVYGCNMIKYRQGINTFQGA